MEGIVKRIYDYTLEDIMGESFGSYAKEIIQDRALPDVRDGLKPVQRRILYGMYRERNTFDNAYKKSAKTVGTVMGTFHPHGDSSIYEAMIRMSQWWKQHEILVDVQGNNGSIDGDGPAAMRYTEARLAKISNELLKDIDKETVKWAPNYDDTVLEPTVLPAKFPNLLVNGCTGISAGYATNIPPHNLGEVIDAVIKRIDSPNCYLDSILDIIKGPDFPTGGIACGKKGLKDAYKTGKGRIIINSNTEFLKEKGKDQILIKEIPFDVNKATLIKKIDEIRLDKKVDGIAEVRDESNRTEPMRIMIDLKKGADKDLVLKYLLKNTDLQVSYNFNMVAIVNHRPMTLGILTILDAYIAHQKEFILNRTKYDLKFAQNRMHIVEGLIKALSILDDVIKTIRASKDKSDAKKNLCERFDFTETQADAIVKLQLYRLTNTDISELKAEFEHLKIVISGLEIILHDEERLKSVMKEELRKIKKEYATERKTQIQEEIEEIKIDTMKMITKEDCVVLVTKDGYVKRTNLRSYKASEDEPLLKENDYVIGLYEVNTMDTLLLFTDKGNYLYIPVYELPDLKWKEIGKHVSNIVKISDEKVIKSMVVDNFDKKNVITIFSKNGMVKRTNLADFKASRYSKPIGCMKLKDDDLVVSVNTKDAKEVFITTYRGYGLRYQSSEIPVIGLKGSGVKAIKLVNDYVVSGTLFENQDYLSLITSKGTGKRIKLTEFEPISRARKGVLVIRDVKTNPYYILKAFIIGNKNELGLKSKENIKTVKLTELPIVDRYSTGSVITKEKLIDSFQVKKLEKIDDVEDDVIAEEVSLTDVDEKILTIDDFLNNIEE